MSGRPLKENLDFSPWDVSILDNDEKIDALIDAQGIGSFTIYFYLCQKAYGSKGYYLDWSFSRCATISRRLGKGASAEYVKNVVDMCFQCGLFDKKLFELYGILTSRGIQKRYLPVAKARTTQQIVFEYWLLSEKESAGLVFCTEKSNYEQPKSNYEQPKSNYEPQKESKGKKSKVNESKDVCSASQNPSPTRCKYGEYKNVLLSDEELEKLKTEFPSDWQSRIENLSEYIASSGKSYKNHLATIRKWAKVDAEKSAENKQKNKFNNYVDGNKISMSAEQIIEDMLRESEG